jgi:hypothetical protein
MSSRLTAKPNPASPVALESRAMSFSIFGQIRSPEVQEPLRAHGP